MINKRSAIALVLLAVTGAFFLSPSSQATAPDAAPVAPTQKYETVYVDTDASGDVNGITVSVHLKTPPNASTLADRSSLENIKSISKGGNPSVNGESAVFQADGEDVYYQGTSNSAPPVECAFSYLLDGKAIAPDALAGKSGKVAIEAKYTNFDRHLEKINGSLKELYTPFTMLTMIELPSDIFSDITVDHGRIIDQGDAVIVVGFGMPGLSRSLDVEDDTLGISDRFTVTATVRGFALDKMTSLAIPGILTAEDIGSIGKLDSLQSDLNDLDSGGKKLSDATDEFKSGMTDFNKNLALYIDGIENMEKGSADLKGGISKVQRGTADLQKGAQALADAMNAAAGKSGDLSGITGQLASLTELSASLSDLSDLLAGLEPLSTALSGLTPGQLSALGIDPASVAALQSAVAAHAGLSKSAADLELYAANLQDTLEGFSSLPGSILEFGKNAQGLADGLGKLSRSLTELEEGAAQLSGGLNELFTNGSALRSGSQSLTDSAGDLATGTDEYSQGVHDFSQGANDSMDDFSARKDAVLALGEAYDNFSLLPDGCEGSVRFVFETNPIKALSRQD